MGEDTLILSIILSNIVFLIFVGAIIIFIKQYRIKKQNHLKEIEKLDLLHKQELIKTQTEIQRETMQHIGREIHDNVGQKLTLSSMYLQQLVFENKTQKITDDINQINNIINQSLSDLRQLSKSLTNDAITNNSLPQLIKLECKKIETLKTHNVLFKNYLQITLQSYRMKSILLRVVQEFIQNSIKHANCNKIEIILSSSVNDLHLHLTDNGKGFNPEKVKEKGIGLKNIKRRLKILNGNFEFDSNYEGTKLSINIPINDL